MSIRKKVNDPSATIFFSMLLGCFVFICLVVKCKSDYETEFEKCSGKFHYNEKIRVINGFYKGKDGVVVYDKCKSYDVLIDKREVTIDSNDLVSVE